MCIENRVVQECLAIVRNPELSEKFTASYGEATHLDRFIQLARELADRYGEQNIEIRDNTSHSLILGESTDFKGIPSQNSLLLVASKPLKHIVENENPTDFPLKANLTNSLYYIDTQSPSYPLEPSYNLINTTSPTSIESIQRAFEGDSVLTNDVLVYPLLNKKQKEKLFESAELLDLIRKEAVKAKPTI